MQDRPDLPTRENTRTRKRLPPRLVLTFILLALIAIVCWQHRGVLKLWWRLLSGEPFRVVVVDAGHGGEDPGATTSYAMEKDIVLDLAKRLATRLDEKGFRVVMTRKDDSFLSLSTRSNIANRSAKAILISLHLNSEPTHTAEGIETFYHHAMPFVQLPADVPPADSNTTAPHHTPTAQSASARLAQTVQSALIRRTMARDRGIKNRPLHILSNSNIPAILVEAGFLSHPDEARLLTSPAYQDLLAEAIADGISIHHSQEKSRLLSDMQKN